jgi:DNA-binding HxlR family transcriptional regulator
MTRRAPLPGRPVTGSTTGRPIMAVFELVSRRWALRVIWELHQADAPLTFRALRDASGGISSSVLTRRLAELGEVGIVERAPAGYVLTPTGERLVSSLDPLLDWSRAWAAELRGREMEPAGIEPATSCLQSRRSPS